MYSTNLNVKIHVFGDACLRQRLKYPPKLFRINSGYLMPFRNSYIRKEMYTPTVRN